MAQMTKEKALDIIENFAKYDAEEILNAVNFLEAENDLVNLPILNSFYNQYAENWDPATQYQDYNIAKQILNNNITVSESFAERISSNASNLATNLAEDKIGDEITLSQHRYIKTIFDDFPQDAEANNKLDEKLVELIQKTIDQGIINFDMVSYADFKWLVDRLPDGELKDSANSFLTSAKQEFEKENGLTIDKKVLEKKDTVIDSHLSEIQLYDEDNNITAEFDQLKPLIEKIEIHNDNGELLNEAEKQQNLQKLFEAAKLEAYQEKIADINYLINSKKEQRKQLSDSILKHFHTKLAITALVPDFELARPTLEEQNDESKFKQFLEKRTEQISQKLEKIFKQAKVTLKESSIITACADTEINLTAFNDLLNKKLGKESKFSKHFDTFKTGCQNLWGKRYEISKNVIKNIRENRVQHIGNAIATGAMVYVNYTAATLAAAGTIAATAAASKLILTASIVYGGYVTAGAVVYPVIAEASRMREEAKEKNQKIGILTSWKQAFTKLKDDKSYKSGIKWALGGAILGAFTGGALSKAGASATTSKLGVTLGRTFASTTAQTTKLITAKRNFKRNPSEANRDALRSARISAGINVTVAGLVTFLGLKNVDAQNTVNSLTNGGNDSGALPINSTEASLPTSQPDTTKTGLWKGFKGLWSGDRDTSTVATQVDTSAINDSIADNQIDTKAIKAPIDTQFVDKAPSDTVVTNLGGNDVPAATTEVETPTTELEVSTTPQPGDVVSTKDYGNGITKTVTMGENGIEQVSYTGLSGGIKVSENVEKFYKTSFLPENCEKNFANQLNVLQKQDSSIKSISQVVENIRAQYELGNFKLPPEMSLEHALNISFMHVLYHGDPSAIYAMSCPNGEDTVTMFSKLAFKFSTNEGVIIGYPVGETHQDKIGSITIKPGCEPQVFIQEQAVDVPEIHVAPTPTIIEQLSVNYAPESGEYELQYPSAYSTNAHNPSGNSIALIDNNGDGKFAAKEVYGGKGQIGLRLSDGDKAEVSATVTDETGKNHVATQTQRIINAKENSFALSESKVTSAAEKLGGKPEEIITLKDENGNVNKYVYLTKDGIEVSYDPNNNYEASIRALSNKGIPMQNQQKALHQAQTMMQDVFQNNNVVVNNIEAAPKSSLTDIAIRNGKKIVKTISVMVNTKTR